MQRAAVVVNPTKVKNLGGLRDRLTTIFRAYGWADPIWWETTIEEPGTAQTRDALARGADLIAALGGDGTARAAAAGMLGTGIPLAVLAGGTGNLFARQLGLPVGRYAEALRIALSGVDAPTDVIQIALDPDGTGQFGEEHVGLVMSGIGRDADVMADTTEKLKSRLSWAAYLVAGLRQVNHELIPAHVRLDDKAEFARDVTAVLAGNCGVLQGGLRLMPDAAIDDGLLDAVIVRGGGMRWLPVLGKVVARSRANSLHLSRAQFSQMTVRVDRPQRAEVDGDVIGVARVARFRADHGALTVRRSR